MPTIGGQFARLAEAATREGQSHVGYLDALLTAEREERKSRAITRLLHGVGHCHTPAAANEDLDVFEFDRSGVSAGQLRALAEGDYVAREPGRRAIIAVGSANIPWTNATLAAILASHVCPAPCAAWRRV